MPKVGDDQIGELSPLVVKFYPEPARINLFGRISIRTVLKKNENFVNFSGYPDLGMGYLPRGLGAMALSYKLLVRMRKRQRISLRSDDVLSIF